MKRHSWTKKYLKGRSWVKYEEGDCGHLDQIFPFEEGDSVALRATSVKECTKCGLRKGQINISGFYPTLAYFRDELVVSVNTIPYECTEIALQMKQLSKEWKRAKAGYFSESDFLLE